MPAPIAAIFVSSTWLDLQAERAAVEQALNRFHEAKFIGMEYFGSRDETTRSASLDEVDRSQLYIGIIGGRYGSGITEAEYRRARERQIDCLIYFKAESAVAPEMREVDAAKVQSLAALKEELRLHTVTTFSSAAELATEVTADVHRWLFDKFLKEKLQQDAIGEIFGAKPVESRVPGADAYRLQVGAPLGSALYTAALPAPQRRAFPLIPNVRRFRGLIDRSVEVEAALAALPTSIPVEIHGETGAGKTVLLRTIAYHPNLTGNPDGVVYLDRVGTQAAADLQQCLYESFYESAPRIKPGEGELRQLLREPRALVLLDDVTQAQPELESLFNLLPNCLLCIASEERRLYGEVKPIALSGLSAADALTLAERELGSALSESDRAAVEQLCTQVQGIPSQVILAVASTKQEGGIPLADLGAGDQAGRAPELVLQHHIESRSSLERRVLALLGVLGAFISKDALAACLPALSVDAALQSLVDAQLVQIDGSAYSLAHGVAPALQSLIDTNATWLDALPKLIAWSEEHRRDTTMLLYNMEALERAAQWAANHSQWHEVLRLVQAIEPCLSASGRWAAWARWLELGARGAEVLGDSTTRAWALHQLGSRAICQGESESAINFLQQALALRIDLGDHWGAALTRHNLDLLRPPIIPAPGSPQPTERSNLSAAASAGWRIAALPRAVKFAGAGLLALATGLVAQTLFRPSPASFKLNFSPPRLEFSSPALHQPSSIQSVSVTNVGDRSLTIGSVGLRGADGSDFTVVGNDCENKRLDPSGRCQVHLRFTPGDVEARAARLAFNDSSGAQTAEIELHGTIAPPAAVGVLSVQPSPVEFGQREIASRASATIVVANRGNAPLRLNDSALAGNHKEDFSLARNTCVGRDLAPQTECTINVDFSPGAAGSRDAALVLTMSDGRKEQVMVRGSGISPARGALRAEPDQIDFGEIDLSRRVERQIELVHSGARPVDIDKTELTGGDSNDFAIAANGCQGISLSQGMRCRIIVSFAPGAAGRRAAALSISSNSRERESTIPLVGFGRAPAIVRLALDPDLLDFGAPRVNAPPVLRRVAVRNNGTAGVRIDQAKIIGADAGAFSIASNACADVLARGAICQITVSYRPTSAGAHAASLQIGFSGGQRAVALRGRAAAEQVPLAGITPTRLDFGEQSLRSSKSADIIIQNRGNGELVVTRTDISGSNSFTMVNRCTRPLAQGSRCGVRITFSPRSIGRHNATLLISHNANSPSRVSLTGIGVVAGAPDISVNPDRLVFGNQAAGTSGGAQTVAVTNSGSAPLAVRAIAIEGAAAKDFSMSQSCTARELVPRGACRITVRFIPQTQPAARSASASRRAATLVINHNAARSPLRIPVEGTAIVRPVNPTPPGDIKIAPDVRVITNGWCCASGNVTKANRLQCVEKKGSFFADQQSAQRSCAPVLR